MKKEREFKYTLTHSPSFLYSFFLFPLSYPLILFVYISKGVDRGYM